jgi:threonine dehydratase
MDGIDADIIEAHARICVPELVRRTPLMHSAVLSETASTLQYGRAAVFCKLESEQVTGSFKARGACNTIAKLSTTADAGVRSRGIVTASTGNHALATAYALKRVPTAAALKAAIFVPRTIAPTKLKHLRACGAPVEVVDCTDCIGSEAAALHRANVSGAVYVSPYNHRDIVAGQGTIGLEIAQQLDAEEKAGVVDPRRPLVVIVPVGGGGLVAGVAAGLKQAAGRRAVVIGAQPAHSDCMRASVNAGRIVPEGGYTELPTLSDGTAGGIEEGSFTFEACRGAATTLEGLEKCIEDARKHSADPAAAGAATGCERLVDAVLTVEEGEIERAVVWMLEEHHKIVEGAAGTGIALVRQLGSTLLAGCTVVTVCCGSNISAAAIRSLLSKYAPEE